MDQPRPLIPNPFHNPAKTNETLKRLLPTRYACLLTKPNQT
jgi:hypothetical protein